VNFDHLRLQLDELERRADETRDPMQWRQIGMECTTLERTIVSLEEEMDRQVAMLEAIRKRLRRLRART
jgi:predicted  nucleic acid-binding Zn-ribbon protein